MNKGDSERMEVRSRLVAKEFKWRDPFMEGTFAATPPLEALRYVLSWMNTIKRRGSRRLTYSLLY